MKTENFTLALSDDQIPWRIFTPSGSAKEYAVLWLQGWTSSMESHREAVERIADQTNLTFFTLDFAGHGEHKLPIKHSTRKQQLDEVAAIYDEIKKLGYDKIIVSGGSFGGYLAALLTGIRQIDTVLLRAPAMYGDDELELPHEQTRKWQNPMRDQHDKANDDFIESNKAVSSIKEFAGYTYVMEHELDEQVPSIMPKTYFKNAKHGSYILIPKTAHTPKNMSNPEPHLDYVEHWVVSILESIQLLAKMD